MTPKQQERIKNKIKKIKAGLAADKKQWGGYYHDGGGLRYLPPELYIKLNDFTGGLRYYNWFNKHFPDDVGFFMLWLDWTIILFKTGRLKKAEKTAFRAYCSNTYLFNVFFDRQITKINKWSYYYGESRKAAEEQLSYSCKQENLTDFSEWLEKFITSDKFMLLSDKFLELQKQLEAEEDVEKRGSLSQQVGELRNEL